MGKNKRPLIANVLLSYPETDSPFYVRELTHIYVITICDKLAHCSTSQIATLKVILSLSSSLLFDHLHGE